MQQSVSSFTTLTRLPLPCPPKGSLFVPATRSNHRRRWWWYVENPGVARFHRSLHQLTHQCRHLLRYHTKKCVMTNDICHVCNFTSTCYIECRPLPRTPKILFKHVNADAHCGIVCLPSTGRSFTSAYSCVIDVYTYMWRYALRSKLPTHICLVFKLMWRISSILILRYAEPNTFSECTSTSVANYRD